MNEIDTSPAALRALADCARMHREFETEAALRAVAAEKEALTWALVAELERKARAAENKAELLQEDIDSLTMCLDKAGAPRKEGGLSLSLWGRVCRMVNEKKVFAVADEKETQAFAVLPTDEMADAYLTANKAYWARADEIPPKNPSQWRTGTPHEATLEGLKAALAAAPKAPEPIWDGVPVTGKSEADKELFRAIQDERDRLKALNAELVAQLCELLSVCQAALAKAGKS